MGKSKLKYSKEFKNNIVKLHLNGHSVSALSIRFGVSKASIYSWISTYSDFPNVNELKILKKQNKDLLEENLILKKALTILSK